MKLIKAPKDFLTNKPLYKPYISNKRSKVGMVYVKNTNGGIRLIHFGDKAMGQYPNDSKRKASYCARSAGIRDKNNRLTKNNKDSQNYWSRLLWNC